MTKKQVARNVKVAISLRELEGLAEQMRYAMTQANLSYIAQGKMTFRMLDVLERFRMFAVDAVKEGL